MSYNSTVHVTGEVGPPQGRVPRVATARRFPRQSAMGAMRGDQARRWSRLPACPQNRRADFVARVCPPNPTLRNSPYAVCSAQARLDDLPHPDHVRANASPSACNHQDHERALGWRRTACPVSLLHTLRRIRCHMRPRPAEPVTIAADLKASVNVCEKKPSRSSLLQRRPRCRTGRCILWRGCRLAVGPRGVCSGCVKAFISKDTKVMRGQLQSRCALSYPPSCLACGRTWWTGMAGYAGPCWRDTRFY